MGTVVCLCLLWTTMRDDANPSAGPIQPAVSLLSNQEVALVAKGWKAPPGTANVKVSSKGKTVPLLMGWQVLAMHEVGPGGTLKATFCHPRYAVSPTVFRDPTGKVHAIGVYRLPGADLAGGEITEPINWPASPEYQRAVLVQRVIVANYGKQNEVVYFTNETKVFRYVLRP